MIRRSTLIAVEILLGLVAALAIGLGVAWWRLSQGPVELGFIRDTIRTELSAAREGRPVGIERVELAWSREGGALELRAVNVTFQNAAGEVLSRSEEARIELAVLPLLIGRVAIERAEFRGGVITVTRKPDGAVHVAFGPEGAEPDIVIPPPPPNETLEQRVVRVLDGLERTFRPVGAGGRLQAISVKGAQLAIFDEGSGGRWTGDEASFELARRARRLELSAQARLEGEAGAAPASLRITTDTRFETAMVEFGATDVRPRAIFSQAALGPFGALDAPFTATVSIGLDRVRGVTRFEGEATLGRGVADMVGGRVRLDGGTVRGRYDIESDELIIDQLALGGDRTRINGEVRVRDVSAILRASPNEPAAFNISLPSLRLDLPAHFSQPIALTNVEAVGAIASGERAIRLTRLSATTGEARLEAAGRIYWAEVGREQALHMGIDIQGQVAGALQAREVFAYWPIGVGESARSYLARTIEAGRVTVSHLRIDIRPSDMAAESFRDEAIDIRFDVTDGAMRFLTTMSPVTNARGAGVLRGNRFDMSIAEARFNNLVVTNGRIEAPRFKPRGAMSTITARLEGDARHLVEVLMQEPIGMGDRLPIEVASVNGRGVVNVRLQRPMVREAPFEDWRFNVEGQITNFAAQMSTRRVALSNGNLTVRGDQRAVTVSGPIRAGASDIESVRWTEHLGRTGRASSQYTIAGTFNADDLERLGYPVARYAQGRIGVTVSGEGRGFDVDNAQVELDLTNAAVEAPRQFWTKRAGLTASARFTVGRHADGGLVFNDIDARGGGLFAQGNARLARDGRLVEANIPRLLIDGRSNARLTAVRVSDGGLDVAVRGALFDAAPFMSGEAAPEGEATRGAAPAPMRASVIVDRLKLRGDATLSNARVELSLLGGGLSTLSVEGQSPGDRAFSLSLNANDPQGGLRFSSGDAGFAARALTGMENVVGGAVTATGTWRGGAAPLARFAVRMRDFQVVRLPAMTRLLSSAGSLTGLVEMLNGDGISFTTFDAQMIYTSDRVRFTEGRMTGPSLGLTGSGAYDIARNDLDIDGVVVPSPGLNMSMLGNVPLIGDLFVSRRGEGIFGMTYAINGAAAQPRVTVNPVSVLTPGILRRIFEPLQPREPVGEGDAAPSQEGALAPPEALAQATPEAQAPQQMVATP